MKSIQTKIVLLVEVGLLIASLIVCIACSFLTSDILHYSAEKQAQLLCEASSEKFNSIFKVIEDSVDTLAMKVEGDVVDESVFLDKESPNYENLMQGIHGSALHHVANIDGTLGVFAVFDPQFAGGLHGICLYREGLDSEFSDRLDCEENPELCERIRSEYLDTARESDKSFWTYGRTSLFASQQVVTYLVPVYKEDTYVGVVGMDLSYDLFAVEGKEIAVYDTGFAAVLDPDGKVVYHPKYEKGTLMTEKNDKFVEILGSVSEETHITPMIRYRVEGEDYRMCLAVLGNGMLMYVSAPNAEIFEKQTFLWIAMLFILLATVAVTLAVSIIFAKKITRPIKELQESARMMMDGNFDTAIVPTSNDEVGELSVSFDEMREKLKKRIDVLYEKSCHDGLTGVGNKTAINMLEREIDAEIAEGNAAFSVVFLDVNSLKVTNDLFGHMAGDDLIRTVALHLCENFGTESTFRIGGDEFVVILRGKNAKMREEEIMASLSAMGKKQLKDYPEVTVSCAHGFASFDPQIDKTFLDTFKRADRSMYLNKSDSKKSASFLKTGEKGIKEIQIKKYCELLSILAQSTEDYPFLLDFENRTHRFFGDIGEMFEFDGDENGAVPVEEVLSAVHPADRAAISEDVTAIFEGKKEEHDMNCRWINRRGETVWMNSRGRVIFDENGNPFVMIGRASAGTLHHLFNSSTGLFNKTKFASDIKDGSLIDFKALMLICIDNLLNININKGRAYGDKLIKLLGETVEGSFDMKNIYHMEKDRFVVLLDTDDTEKIEGAFESLKAKLDDEVSISAAVVGSNTAFVDEENIYDHAKQLLKDNRSSGMGKLYFFTKDQLLNKLSAANLLGEIEESVKNGCEGFYLCYQPKIYSKGYPVVSAEALLRYKSKEHGNVFPDQFIPLLERTGLINEVGLWVLDTALAQCKKWRKVKPDFGISVNFSAVQLRRSDVVDKVEDALEHYGIPADALTIELTESVQLDKSSRYDEIFARFRNMGVKISIDDFGTGYSNLSYLKKIHADEIKIDRFFISDIKQDSYNYKVVSNIVDFAKKNSFTVCLEGVETPAELAVLEGLEFDLLQGYLFDRPIPAEEFEEKHVLCNEVDSWKFLPELYKHRSKVHIFKFDPKDILTEIDMGLWVIKVTNGVGELFADSKMRELIGVDDTVCPTDCYDVWRRGIPEDQVEVVDSMVAAMAAEDKVMQVEYPWRHPLRGEVIVRCSGKCVRKEENVVEFEGFHRIISDMGASYRSSK